MSITKQLFALVALSALFAVASAQARTGCSRNGTVQDSDTCDILSARDNVSTFQLANANKAAIDPLCDNIFPGELLCLGLTGQDCDTITVVKEGDSCATLTQASGVPLATILANNPNVNSDCSNIYPGEVLCTSSQVINYST
ncbi:hypothetical protein BC834DRAFT_974967 [Gloeopeniophorella convolvens]|nr:hypothetical protein BC834DRAFT_974967 [Gloeopeniophorella convolvens]